MKLKLNRKMASSLDSSVYKIINPLNVKTHHNTKMSQLSLKESLKSVKSHRPRKRCFGSHDRKLLIKRGREGGDCKPGWAAGIRRGQWRGSLNF